MKLLRLPKQRALNSEGFERNECEHESRLQDAETRANRLVETAEWIRASVAHRDQENHWQASVNRLFLGGSP